MPTIVETAPIHAGTTMPPHAVPLESAVWVVRLDRPDGSHTYVGPEPNAAAATSRQAQEQQRWSAAGLWAPTATVVSMSAGTFIDHARHRTCMSSTCHRSADVVPRR